MTDYCLSPERAKLAEQIPAMLGGRSAKNQPELSRAVAQVLAETDDEDLNGFLEQIQSTGADWGYHPANPVARRVVSAVQQVLLLPGSRLGGTESLEVARERPAVFFGNHVAFSDANVLAHLVACAGYDDLARGMVAAVGPKVYTSVARRIASLAFGTIKLPQSPSRATAEVRLGAREVARLSYQALEVARERLAAGEHLIVFVEGSRSHDQGMKTALAAVARYLSFPRLAVIPFGLWGSEALSPADYGGLSPALVEGRLGPALDAARILDACGNNRVLCMHVIGILIARLLPPAYRGAYAETAPKLGKARELARELSEA